MLPAFGLQLQTLVRFETALPEFHHDNNTIILGWHLFIARFFLGIGIGPKSATVPVYAAEVRKIMDIDTFD